MPDWFNWVTGPLIVGWLFVLVWVPIVVLTQRKAHPAELFTLFFAELWERFSFYGMRALLTLYMTKKLFVEMSSGEADATSLGIYGAFNAMLYGSPVIGGLLADKLMGFRRAIIFGGIAMSAGQFVLAFTTGSETWFYYGLGLIVVGNGFFKPNVSSFVGEFYDKDDPRKDGAFTIFYMGINIGAFLSPLTCGYLGERVDWKWGFFAAGVGIVLGTLVFWWKLRNHGDKGGPPNREELHAPAFGGLSRNHLIIAGSFLAVVPISFLLRAEPIVDAILIVAGVLILGYLSITAMKEEDKEVGERLLVVPFLFIFHMVFWALFEQAGGSLTLFTERNVERYGIPASQFQSVNAFFIMVLAPVFSWIWLTLRKKNIEPRTPTKFVLGLAQLALGYYVLVLGARYAPDGVMPMIFLIIMYLFHTTGELSLSPVGLSIVTKLAPSRIVGFVMGTWFMSIAFAHRIAVEIGKLTARPSNPVEDLVSLVKGAGKLQIEGAEAQRLVQLAETVKSAPAAQLLGADPSDELKELVETLGKASPDTLARDSATLKALREAPEAELAKLADPELGNPIQELVTLVKGAEVDPIEGKTAKSLIELAGSIKDATNETLLREAPSPQLAELLDRVRSAAPDALAQDQQLLSLIRDTSTDQLVQEAPALEVMTQSIDVYWDWGVLVVLGAAAVLLVLTPKLKKWMHGIH